MGTQSEIVLVSKRAPFEGQTVLEIGAAFGNPEAIRQVAKATKHIGLDMQEGKFVDLVHNLNEPVPLDPVDTILCFSVLEHCNKPWIVAKNLINVLKKDGLLLLSVPFQWKVHGYPNDYWRFTPNGIKELFPDIEWIHEETDPPKMNLTQHQGQKILLLFVGKKR
jgi:SAM-dependent methyltransferase